MQVATLLFRFSLHLFTVVRFIYSAQVHVYPSVCLWQSNAAVTPQVIENVDCSTLRNNQHLPFEPERRGGVRKYFEKISGYFVRKFLCTSLAFKGRNVVILPACTKMFSQSSGTV